jgi:hypothetical protein
MFRQGDVAIIPVDRLPEQLKQVERDHGRIVLAYGEVTGHAHAIASADADLFETPGATAAAIDRFLRVRSVVTLDHEEHTAITIPPGDYIVRTQVEWSDAMEPVRVLD